MPSAFLAIAIGLLMRAPLLGAATGEEANPVTPMAGEKETIVIRADRAWEEPDGRQVLRFEGNFELISPDWTLTADTAELYGPLDDPVRIVARGKPARVHILDAAEPIVGRGGNIEYLRDTDILTLSEDAQLEGESISMKSAQIVYDLDGGRLQSSADSGVEMILQREKP